MRCEILVSRFI